MSGRPARGCSTFGRADFIRVPFPAARMTTCVSIGRPTPPPQLSRGSRLQRSPPVETWDRWHLERRSKRVVGSQRLQIGIGPGEGAILRIEGDCPLEVGNRLGLLGALRV